MFAVGVFWRRQPGVVSAAFAVGVPAGNRSRAANRFLAFFLLLIAGNQLAETCRALATTSAARLTWFRIASVQRRWRSAQAFQNALSRVPRRTGGADRARRKP